MQASAASDGNLGRVRRARKQAFVEMMRPNPAGALAVVLEDEQRAAFSRWELASAKLCHIEVSDDGATWRSVYSTTSGRGGVEVIPLSDVQACHVRIGLQRRAPTWGFSLYEIEVWGTG